MSEEEEIVLEREYIVPLKEAYRAPRYRRGKRAVHILRNFALRHMKTEEIRAERVIISPEINELIWRRGARKPPRKIKVKILLNREGEAKVLPVEQ